MMDREFTFSDQRVIDELKKNFVTAEGNTHELQNGRSPARDWFMDTASRINPRVKKDITAQGFYVVGADGKAYGFNNNRDPDRVLQFIQAGEAKFKADPPAAVTISADLVAAPFSHAAEPTTSILRVFARIRPLPMGCDVLNTGIGRDHIWIYPEEVQQILAAADRGRDGIALPKTLTNRLARYHLVDNVRGEPDFWNPSQIKACTFTAKELPPKGSYRTISFTGAYHMATASDAHGLKGILDGEFTLDPVTSKVISFRAYGEAEAWGAGTYTPSPPEGHFKMVFAIVNVADEAARSTPPQAAAYGDGEYRHGGG